MQIIEIDNLTTPELAVYASLTESGLRAGDVFIAESPKVIERAIDAGIKPLSLLCERKHIEGDAQTILEKMPDIPVFTASRKVLASLTGYELTRGVLCAMLRPSLVGVSDILSTAKRVCVIDGVCDATNVGAIIRSAAALGFDGLIMSGSSCDPLNRRSIRVSMGTVFQVPWCIMENPIKILKEFNFTTVSTALGKGSRSLEEVKPEKEIKYAVIFGSEGYGLPNKLISESDLCVNIPMHRGVDSLNVGAAAAIILWHFRP